jgi:hypothetical protein
MTDLIDEMISVIARLRQTLQQRASASFDRWRERSAQPAWIGQSGYCLK